MDIIVTTPATTANLGPGFDSLGLALDLWNQTVFSTATDVNKVIVGGEGRGKLPEDEQNLIFLAAKTVFERAEKPMPPLRITCQNGIPLSSGLGSSSAAVLAGLLGANNLLNDPFSHDELLNMACNLEGHADNVAPALLGGLVITATEKDEVLYKKVIFSALAPPIYITVVLPAFEFSTEKARAALPEKISHADAIFNISRTALVIEALKSGNANLLGKAMQDRLHQPYRLPLIPAAQKAMDSMRQAGAEAIALSGAGPSLIAFSAKRDEAVGEAAKTAFDKAGLTARVFQLQISQSGAKIIGQ